MTWPHIQSRLLPEKPVSNDIPIAICTPSTSNAQTLVSQSHSPIRGFRATTKNGYFQGWGRKPQGELVQRVRKCSKTNGDRSKDTKGAWNGHHGQIWGDLSTTIISFLFSLTVCLFPWVWCIDQCRRDDRIRISPFGNHRNDWLKQESSMDAPSSRWGFEE